MKDKTLVEIVKVDNILIAISQEEGCEVYKDLLYMWYVEKRAKEDIAVLSI